MPSRWILGGLLAIVIGLAVWATTFVLVPAGVVLLAIGVVRLVRGPRARVSSGPGPEGADRVTD